MNQRELGELRRRFRPEKSAISRVYGCYVNSSREIIAYIDQSLGLMPQEEAEKYLGLLKKALSGCGATSFLRNSDKIYEKKRNASQAPGRRFWPSAAARTRTRSWRPLWTRWWPPGSLIVRSVGWRWTTRPTPCDCYCSKWGGM